MKAKSIALSIVGLLTGATLYVATSAHAGEMVQTAAVPAAGGGAGGGSLIDPITGAVTVGFDSHYIFRGTNLGENAPWGSVDLNVPLGSAFNLGLGAWYIHPTSPAGALPVDKNDELDLYASLGTTVGPLDVAVGYTAFIYPEADGGETNEVGISLGTSLGIFDASFGYYHDFDLETNYFEWALGTTFELTDRVGLSLGAALGHFEDKLSNVLITASLPIRISDSAVLEPYIAGSINGGDIEGPGRKDQLFGGASLSLSF